jgi:hypothetical protein
MMSNITQPTQDGGKFGDTLVQTEDTKLVKSRTYGMAEFLPIRIMKTRKPTQSSHWKLKAEETQLNNGLSDILIH